MTGFAELHEELRAVARGLLGGTAGVDVGRARIADAGWLGLEVPEELGGAGATFAEVAVVLDEMGRAASASPYLGTAVLGVGALLAAAPHPRRDELLRAAASGETRLAVALGAGADRPTASAAFRIERTAGAALLHGRAEFVVDGPLADRLLLLADDPEQGVVLLALEPARVAVGTQPVLDATRSFGVVVADGVPLPEDSVLPFEGDPEVAAQHLVDRAAVAIACDSLGVAAAMLDATVVYVGVRHQFDRPVGSFQAVKHACADMLVQLSVGRELVGAAVDALATEAPGAEAAVARAKSFATAAAVDIVGAALQLHGGIGYTWESGIHVYLKRAVLNRSLLGAPSAHRRRLAALLLDSPG